MNLISLIGVGVVSILSCVDNVTPKNINKAVNNLNNEWLEVDNLLNYNETGYYYQLRYDISAYSFFNDFLSGNDFLATLNEYTFNGFSISNPNNNSANAAYTLMYYDTHLITLTNDDFRYGTWYFYFLDGDLSDSLYNLDEYFEYTRIDDETTVGGYINPYIEIDKGINDFYCVFNGVLYTDLNTYQLYTLEYVKGDYLSFYTDGDDLDFNRTINTSNGNYLFSIFPLNMGTFPYTTNTYRLSHIILTHNSYLVFASLFNDGYFNGELYVSEIGLYNRSVGFPSWNFTLTNGTFKHSDKYYDTLTINHVYGSSNGTFHTALTLSGHNESITIITIDKLQDGTYTIEKNDDLLITFINVRSFESDLNIVVTNFFNVYKTQAVIGGGNVNDSTVSDLFGLFASAFNSLNGILSIRVFSFITLGTLLLIPFVALILFFILNLFKR